MNQRRRTASPEAVLEVRPVLNGLHTPRYPTRQELLGETPVAHRAVSAWGRSAKGVAGAATVFLAISIGGCDGTPPANQPTMQTVALNPGSEDQGTLVVAPIFDHGNGHGADGCVVMTPPVFLSEEEAMQLIREELGKHGITLAGRAVLVETRVKLPLESMWPKGKDAREFFGEYAGKMETLSVDGVDKVAHVAVEFISDKDCRKLDPIPEIGTVRSFQTKKIATHLADLAAKQRAYDLRLAIFYDPLVEIDFGGSSTWQEEERQSKEKSKTLLRKQVQDFVAWLNKKE